MSVMKMTMRNVEQQGDAFQKLVSTNETVAIHLLLSYIKGGNIDTKV